MLPVFDVVIYTITTSCIRLVVYNISRIAASMFNVMYLLVPISSNVPCLLSSCMSIICQVDARHTSRMYRIVSAVYIVHFPLLFCFLASPFIPFPSCCCHCCYWRCCYNDCMIRLMKSRPNHHLPHHHLYHVFRHHHHLHKCRH